MERVLKKNLEREITFRTAPSYRLPEIPGETLSPRVFTSTYYDSADFRLTRLGVILRRRTERKRVCWQLMIPRNTSRLELEISSGRSTPPEPFSDLLFGVLRHKPLNPMVKLRTLRSGIKMQRNDHPIAEVVLDRVAILDDRRVAGRLNEVHVEPYSDNGKDLSALEKSLRESGAQDGDLRPQVAQALHLNFPSHSRNVPLGHSPLEYLPVIMQKHYLDILLHDPGTRLGQDSEELHQMRVGFRKFRSFLRAAQAMLVPEWYANLQGELKWIGDILGTVRDFDVLSSRLGNEAKFLSPSERVRFDHVLATLRTQGSHARNQLLLALRSDRYLSLLTQLEQAVQTPAFQGNYEISLVGMASKEFKRLMKTSKTGYTEASDQDLHNLRIRTKHARYAVELALESTGKSGVRYVRQTRQVQEVLGDHQDGILMEEHLRKLLQTTRSLPTAFVIGQIVERAQARRRQAKALFPREWKKLKKRGRETFMHQFAK